MTPACERSAAVREALEAELGLPCADIAAADLREIVELRLRDVHPGDLDGLSNLSRLKLRPPSGWTLRAGALDGLAGLQMLNVFGWNVLLQPGSFRGLANLHHLVVLSNRFDGADALPPLRLGVFEGMPRLRHLRLIDASRAAIEPGLFEGLAELNELFVGGGRLAHLPAGMFRGLPNLRRLEVDMSDGSSPVTMAAGVFEGLANLEDLRLNSLAAVPPGVFAGLSELRMLWLRRNAFTSLEAGVFEGLSSLEHLRLDNARYPHSPHRQELASLPPGLFAGLPLGWLHLTDVGLRELRPGAFRELERLGYLYLDNNRLAELAPETFDGVQLGELDLGGNRLQSLPAGLFEDQPWLQRVDLSHNRLATLPSGLFVGAGARRRSGMAVALHGNPGAPFRLALEPVVASAAWERPARVGVRVAEGAPFRLDVGLAAAGGRLEAGVATIAHATPLSNAVAVSPAGAEPVVVRVAGIPGGARGGLRGHPGRRQAVRAATQHRRRRAPLHRHPAGGRQTPLAQRRGAKAGVRRTDGDRPLERVSGVRRLGRGDVRGSRERPRGGHGGDRGRAAAGVPGGPRHGDGHGDGDRGGRPERRRGPSPSRCRASRASCAAGGCGC